MELVCRTAKKNQRDSITDRTLVAKLELPKKGDIDLVAVFDGHGPPTVVNELLRVLPGFLADKIDQLQGVHAHLLVSAAVYQAIVDVDYKLYQGGGMTGGSSAVIALWPHGDQYLYIANIGNSRAVVWSTNIILETTDHTSRSIGDMSEGLKLVNNRYLGVNAPVSSEPDIYCLDLRRYSRPVKVVLASDGFWDKLTSKEITKLVDTGATCEELVDEAIRRGSSDNITIVVLSI